MLYLGVDIWIDDLDAGLIPGLAANEEVRDKIGIPYKDPYWCVIRNKDTNHVRYVEISFSKLPR